MPPTVASFGSDRPIAAVVTMTPWHEPPRIRHQVTRQLTRFYNVLYVELPTRTSQHRDAVERISDRLIVFRPAGLSWLASRLSNNLGCVRQLHYRNLARKIEAWLRAAGAGDAVLVNFQFDFPQIMDSPLFRRRIYLCNDDFQVQLRWWIRSHNRRAENKVIARADVCLAVSLPLVDKLRTITTRAELFLPGHEFASGNGAVSVRPRAKPVRVGYMGYVNGRLRVDWLTQLAADPQIALTLIGPIEGAQQFSTLLAGDRVEHVDTMVGEELQARLSTFDVFIMPYDAAQPGVRAISAPNKLFQYLACGRPVVCTALPGLLPMPEKFIYAAADGNQFVRAVHAAFEEDNDALARARLDFSAGNTWQVRGDALHAMLRDSTGGAR